MARTRPSARRAPLSRAAIVATGVALADEHGVGALTMRSLAGRLGYEVMSLYNHVGNKDELLSLMVDSVAAEVGAPPPDAEALGAARAIAVANRDALVRHPWAPELWQRFVPGPARTDLMERLLGALAESGLSPDLAHHGFHAVNNHIIGYTLQEQQMVVGGHDPDGPDDRAHEYLAGISPETHPHTVAHVRQHLDGDTSSSFELVLDLILNGLVRLQRGR